MAEDSIQDFQNVTNIRRITQQSLVPVIRRLQLHIQQLMDECQLIKDEGKNIKVLTELQEESSAKTDRLQKECARLEDMMAKLNKEQDEVRLEGITARDNLKIEIADLRKDLLKKDQKFTQMTRNRDTLHRHIEQVHISYKNDLSIIHSKLSEVYRDTLDAALQIKSKYFQYDNEFTNVRRQTKTVNEKFSESNKKMQLYLAEREVMNEKMEHLYKHIFNHVSIEQFDKFRKYQSVELNSTVERIKGMLDAAISEEVRDFLPTVLEQAKEVQKIGALQERQDSLAEEMKEIAEKIESRLGGLVDEMTNSVEERFQWTKEETLKKSKELERRVEKIQATLNDKIDIPTLETYLAKTRDTIYKVIDNNELQLEKTLDSFVKEHSKELYDTIESLVPSEEKQFWTKLKLMLPRIEQIQRDAQAQCSSVTSLASGLSQTLERFSNRITKIKTDLELKDDLFGTQIKFLKKNREQHDRRFQVLGKLLSCQSQMIILLGISHINELAQKRRGLQHHLNQVFVSFCDGLIYELKLVTDPQTITYRKKTLNKLDLSCASLTCFLSVLDSHFDEEFLCWQKYRPSGFFRANVLDQLQHERNKGGFKPHRSSVLSNLVNPSSQHIPQLSVSPQLQTSSALDVIDLRDSDKGLESGMTTVLESMNIVEVKDNSMEIFAKTTELRRKEFSRHRKVDHRYLKSGSQTSRMNSAQRSRP